MSTHFTIFHPVGATDKALIALALDNRGIKARLRVFRTSIRVVFEGGDVEAVAGVLNAYGYRAGGGKVITPRHFIDLREVHVFGAVH